MATRSERRHTLEFSTPDLISWLHDATNLIRNIDLCTHLLASPNLDHDTRRRVHQSAVRTISLLTAMHPHLRQPSRRGQRSAVCELNEAIDSSVKLLQARAQVVDVLISFARASDLLFVKGDRATYQRLICNLLLNAVEASARGARVIVKLARTDDSAIVMVTNRGSSISPVVYRRLFKEPVTTKRNGSGRGLLHSATTVAALGGTMAFESRLRTGTTVTLRFPTKSAQTKG